MSKFKLLAIRPLIGCDKRFLKNLTSGQIYPLYHNYSYYDSTKKKIMTSSNEEIRYISFDESPPNIYNTKTADGHKIDINISAIAGKNGSGKSSLIELFFACIYLYCTNENILEPNLNSLDKNSKKFKKQLLSKEKQQLKVTKQRDNLIKDLSGINGKLNIKSFDSLKIKINDFSKLENDLKEFDPKINTQLKDITNQQNEIVDFNQKLKAEIYYQIDDQFYCLHLNYDKKNDKHICEIITISDLNNQNFKSEKMNVNAEEFARHFFYTIAINYSHYALNSFHFGGWITSLFHKNDGYKTPIVISPMRTDGNFDINSEISFAKYRLLTNKLQEYNIGKGDKIYIAENHFIDKVVFTLNWRKVDAIPKRVRFRMNKILGTARDINMLNTFLSTYLSTEELLKFVNDFPLKQIISNYLINKINSIPEKYPWFGKGYHFSSNTKHLENDEFFDLLKKDKSHVTYKLKQTINFLKRSLNDNKNGFIITKEQIDRRTNIRFEFTLEDLIDWMENQSGREIMANLPPSLFDIDFNLANGTDSNYLFSALSSGEQQLVHTIQSVIYHLNNIQSAHLGEGERLKYNNVNIIYDEIELYFHPDYQRRFIADLLKEFERFYIGGNKGVESVNIILLTHSPFILSDIPSNNIMLLDSDKRKRSIPKIPKSQTFAANINELLADSFFLKGTLMGKHAENQIKKSIGNIKNNDTDYIDDTLFDIVGDTFLKTSLENFKKRQYDQNTDK